MEWISLLALGLCAGVLSGMFGIGGGVVIVPALLLFWKMPIKSATGTSLGALLMPVGILAVIEYARASTFKFSFAAMIAVGLLIGAWLGAKLALQMPPQNLKRFYGAFLIAIGVYMLFLEPILKASALNKIQP